LSRFWEEVEMRTQRLTFSVLLLLVAGVSGSVLAADLTPASVWMTDFSKAQAEAKRLNRPLVVHFHTHYCPPCRKMEKDILNTPQVLKQLDAGFVAVKVNLSAPANAAVQAKFRVEAMPTDLVLSPDGKVLVRSEGYDDRTTADRQKYLNSIARIDAQYTKEGKRLARTEPAAEVKSPVETAAKEKAPTPATQSVPAVASATPILNKLVPEPVEPQPIDDPAAPVTEKPELPETAPAVVALDGYSTATARSRYEQHAPGRRETSSSRSSTMARCICSSPPRTGMNSSPTLPATPPNCWDVTRWCWPTATWRCAGAQSSAPFTKGNCSCLRAPTPGPSSARTPRDIPASSTC
jgi:thiol-disulfide isomerase/thioredoxin